MAKFNMKEYENFMEEEARQDRLQEELEDKRMEEAHDAEENWQDYQREQEEERRCEEFNNYPEYDEDDFDDDDSENSYGIDSLSFEELVAIFFEDVIELRKTEERKKADKMNELYFIRCEQLNADLDTVCECITRKATARNRHLNEVKAKKRAQQSAAILESKYRTSSVGTDYEEFRLYSRSTAAAKKVARVKTA